MIIPGPRFGGIKERYTRTSAGAVLRLLDPVRMVFHEFPNTLHAENFVQNFLDPKVDKILIGGAMPAWAQAHVARPRHAQFYRYHDSTAVIYEIAFGAALQDSDRWVAAGVRVSVRTARVIRSCPLLLEGLSQARFLLATYHNLALDEERNLVAAWLAQRRSFTMNEIWGDQPSTPSKAADRTSAAVLRAVAAGECTIDWTEGRLSRSTVVVRTNAPARVHKAPERYDARGARMAACQLPVANLEVAVARSASASLRARRGHGR